MEVRGRACTDGIPQKPALILADKWLRLQLCEASQAYASRYMCCCANIVYTVHKLSTHGEAKR